MSDKVITVGELVARFLEKCDVDAAFGVISIHNMPILDAIGRRGHIRFVAARGEAGAGNMADAYARVRRGLGVAITSTGTAAGNIAGAMVEALTAGAPVLHLTGQIEVEHLDMGRAYIHEAPNQMGMMAAFSKKAFRITTAEQALEILKEAVQLALTAPTGPVSIEIPIDVQRATIQIPAELSPLPTVSIVPSQADIERIADRLIAAKRPILWLGGGTRHARAEATRLADMGIGIVTSTNGRAIVPEDHPMSLGAFNVSKMVEGLYQSLDLMIVIGSRLRGNETWTYKLDLPANMVVVDCDPAADRRCYPNDDFVHSDARYFLTALADAVEGRLTPDPALQADFMATLDAAQSDLNAAIQPYDRLVADIQAIMPDEAIWVRDVTLSNSMWGNRLLKIDAPHCGVHALGGGIGQGLPMGIGAAIAAAGRKTIILCGDGGTTLCLGEFATLADENPDVVVLLMNDNGYGVIKNIQDAEYGSRKYYSDIQVPDFGMIAGSLGLPYQKVDRLDDFQSAMQSALASDGAQVVEIDMVAIGPFSRSFSGPPKKD